MLPAVMVIAGLLATAVLTASAVQSQLTAASADKAREVAFYAAESGIASGERFLSDNVAGGWSIFVTADNASPQEPSGIVGNGVMPGNAGNPFTANMSAWYEVRILNNKSDPGFSNLGGVDSDNRVILQVRGHGPNNSLVVLEVEVAQGGPEECPAYAQRGMSALGSGFNPCLAAVTGGATQVFNPN